MNSIDKWCMKWNEFDANIREYLRVLRYDQRLFDVTLVSDDGQHIQAHKIILSSGSNFFSDIFLKSNQANMLIYLKGINSVQLEHLLNFIYNGEASVGQEELKEFLETGKNLQVKGFEAYVSNVSDEPNGYINENAEICENRDNNTEQNVNWDTLKPLVESNFSSEDALIQKDEENQMNSNTELDLQILELIAKSGGVWKCKVCGKTTPKKGHIREHAEIHIKGMSHACHLCNNTFPSRQSLRKHINGIHSKLLSCDLCEKSGMNRTAYYHHRHKQHKTLSGTALQAITSMEKHHQNPISSLSGTLS